MHAQSLALIQNITVESQVTSLEEKIQITTFNKKFVVRMYVDAAIKNI